MIDLAHRSTDLEIMDDPKVSGAEIHKALGEIEAINKLLGGYSVVTDALGKIANGKSRLHVVDIGCGGGDMLRKIADWSKHNNTQVKLTGVDINSDAIAYATERSKAYPAIGYKPLDVFNDEILQLQPDVTICSLFCHHFETPVLVPMIQRIADISKHAVIINDLHRHWFAYNAISVLTKVLSKSRLVRYDAKLSVARAFTRKDWEAIMIQAGISNYTLKWRWAWRWQLVIYK